MNNLDSSIKFDYLPLDMVQDDDDQPRTDLGNKLHRKRLQTSISEYGIQIPLVVTKEDNGLYTIIDGHRRFECAKDLGLPTVPCLIYPKLSEGELETKRFEIQNNRKSWTPIERSNCLHRIKNEKGFNTIKELADYLHLSETLAGDSLTLTKIKLDYLEMMTKYDLGAAYQKEFVRLKQKLRKIKGIEISAIVKIIFDKIKEGVIPRAKDLRILGWIFKRATINENEIYSFLTNLKMTIQELDELTTHTGLSGVIEQAIQRLKLAQEKEEVITSKEEDYLKNLLDVLTKTLQEVKVSDEV